MEQPVPQVEGPERCRLQPLDELSRASMAISQRLQTAPWYLHTSQSYFEPEARCTPGAEALNGEKPSSYMIWQPMKPHIYTYMHMLYSWVSLRPYCSFRRTWKPRTCSWLRTTSGPGRSANRQRERERERRRKRTLHIYMYI